MTLQTLAAIVATTAALAQVSARPADEAVGVLIGLHDRRDDDRDYAAHPTAGRLRTLWIQLAESETPRPAIEMPELLVPRRSGFWRVGLLATCSESLETDLDGGPIGSEITVADYLWSARVGERPRIDLRPDDPDDDTDEQLGACTAAKVSCANDFRTSVFWIFPEYASLELGTRGSCGAHPDWSPGYTVRSLDDVRLPLTIETALGAATDALFRRRYEQELKAEIEYWDKPAVQSTFEPRSWHITREAGRWSATGWANTHRLVGFGFFFTADADLSHITGTKNGIGDWARLHGTLPHLDDAHFGPSARWVLLRVARQLMLTTDPVGVLAGIRAPAWRYELPASEDLVMVEWSAGSHVSRWDAEVRRVLAGPVPEPIIGRPSQ